MLPVDSAETKQILFQFYFRMCDGLKTKPNKIA